MSIYKLYELVNIYKGSNLITKKYIEQNKGIYPVISSKTTENGVYGFINTYDYEKDKITMSSDGENAGTTFWQEKNFSLTNHALVFIMNKLIKYNYKYLFLTLKKHESKIKDLIISGSTRPGVSLNLLKSINIKLPSIEEQDAIISIIEPIEKLFVKYSNLVDISSVENVKRDIDNLISIIEPIEKVINNIKNVKIKIESLVNKYFDFLYSDLKDSNFKKYILGDLFTINRGQIINSKYIDNNIGPYPVISSNTKNNGIFGYINSYMYDGEFITISADGAYAGTVFLQNGKFSITNVCFILIKNKYIDFKFNNKFVYYILKKEQEINRLKSQVGSSRPAVREYSLKEIKINLPNMEIQEEFSKIVEPLLNLSTKANKIEKILNDSLLKITKKLIV